MLASGSERFTSIDPTLFNLAWPGSSTFPMQESTKLQIAVNASSNDSSRTAPANNLYEPSSLLFEKR